MPLTVESSGEIVAKIPRLPDGLYEPLRNPLYTVDELMKGWDSAKKSLDERISDLSLFDKEALAVLIFDVGAGD